MSPVNNLPAAVWCLPLIIKIVPTFSGFPLFAFETTESLDRTPLKTLTYEIRPTNGSMIVLKTCAVKTSFSLVINSTFTPFGEVAVYIPFSEYVGKYVTIRSIKR